MSFTYALLAALQPIPAAPSPPPAVPLPRVVLDTSAGRIVVELDVQRAPVTAGNFLRYATQKRLDGVKFYRIVKAAPNFGFIQFGVSGDPRRALPPIKHEATTQTGLRHRDGTISVARFEPGSARGDFTISVGDQPSLDANPAAPGDNQGFAAFGQVVEGMDVVRQILDAPIAPDWTENGSFRGEVPVAPVLVQSARVDR